MKKDYLAPELELITFSFESILETRPLDTSGNENGGSDYNDDNSDDW